VPNIKSAIKRVDVAERNRVRNRSWKSAVRTVRNEVTDSVKVADVKKAGEALKNAYEVIDKAVSKGILHKNSAARKKSQLAKSVFALSAAGSAKK
jgi:small subunit ribosomal protein S20